MKTPEEIVEEQAKLAKMAEEGGGEVVVRMKVGQLAYYQGLERLLGDALQLATRNRPPIIQIEPAEIQEAVTGAIESLLSGARQIGEPRAHSTEIFESTIVHERPEPKSSPPRKRVRGGPAPAEEEKKGKWLPAEAGKKRRDGFYPVRELIKRSVPQPAYSTVMASIYAGEIMSKGEGRKRLVEEASYLKWLEKHKPRRRER